LITGGSKGLGRAIAIGLAETQTEVVIVGRSENHLQAAAEEITRATGTRAHYLVADLVQPGEPERVVEQAREMVGPIDILINNAAINVPERAEAITDDAWDAVMALNVRVAMRLTRAVTPAMRARGWGRIVNISSVSPNRPLEGSSAYATSKAALDGLTRASAIDLLSSGVTVNAIAPGFLSTQSRVSLPLDAGTLPLDNRAPLGASEFADEIIGPVLFLASEAASHVTGHVINVDGGWTLT
jgi:NAD(P)-dependent dehydrogenase (short-subunit alcohol dehydrogenase family)